MTKIVSQTADGAASVEFEYDFGTSIAEASEKFGEKIVWAYALRALTIAAQGAARGMIKGGKDKDAIVEAMKTWKPGEPRQVKSAEEKLRELVANMSPEERAKLAGELKLAGKASKGE